ncbi:MAG: 16S rRNA (guanine(966)-N(2))-methyltransferase RsmD [Lachnospiraceae bacterium]|nr:16S rRNA (guanine(966)-N(2))-methyltransferase RsmD [Lachnospiraceae bacterium]
MRVIAGSARRTNLVTPAGMDTRPTTDRIKETLFNMINYDLPDCRFLDLFAGSGGIGIEALSRGAREAVFVEQAAEPLRCIRTNLEKTAFTEQSRVLAMDVMGALKVLEADGTPFDIIFMDPPYRDGFEERILRILSDSKLCTPETLIIIEAALDTEFAYAETLGFTLVRQKQYKTNQHVFIKQTC